MTMQTDILAGRSAIGPALWRNRLLIGLVALKTGRPAALAYTRAESMMSTTKRHPADMRATIGADAEGRVTGMVFEGDFNTGAYASWGPTVAVRVPVHASGPYFTPNYRAVGRAIHTNGPISGAFRGFGVPQATISPPSGTSRSRSERMRCASSRPTSTAQGSRSRCARWLHSRTRAWGPLGICG